MKRKIYFGFPVLFIALFYAVAQAHAATLYLLPDQRSLSIGQEFNLDLKIDSGSASTSVNSAQATIQFPAGVLNAVSVDKQNSVFSFWLEEPIFSNNDGTIHFVGGAIRGVAGSSLQVLRMKFKVTGAGHAEFKINDAAVTAADGKGTNILSETKGASVSVGTNVLPSSPTPPAGGTSSAPIEQPKKIEQIPIKATGLPDKPKLRVSLYPDESRWYDRVGDVIVLWDVPADVTQVATRLSHAKDNAISVPEKELFNGKSFGILQEGIWYIKVQFKNNVGWSEPAYYKISIDTTPPLPFDAKIDSAVSDNPSPTIRFETSDSLSGIAGYVITVDGKELAVTTSTTIKLPAQPPGKHSLVVSANDLAENAVQDNIGFEVLALPTPKIEFITQSVPQGEFVFASGKGMAGGSVEVSIVDKGSREVFRGTAPADNDGHWDITVKEPLAIGQYLLSTTSHDDRGALSLPSAPQSFKVRAKSVISFGFVELGWFGILMIVVLAITAGGSLWSLRSLKRAQIRGAYAVILGRDVEKLSDLLAENIKELSEISSVRDSTDAPYLIGQMKENVDKIKRYIKQEADKLK